MRPLPRGNHGSLPRHSPTPAQCATCHEDAVNQFNRSIHGVSHLMGALRAADCADCHGTHEMVPVKQIDSPVFKLNLPRTCATCHNNPGLTEEYRMHNPQAASHSMESLHRRALTKLGLIVAPSCNDCHGVHDIKRSVDHDSYTHFRLEKFPMDTVILSGRVSKTEMLHERRRWYDRLVADGRLEDFRVKDEWEGHKGIAKGLGFMFFGIGLILLVLIVYAMASCLGH